MNRLGVRIILAILVGVLLGYAVAAGPALYQQWQGSRALLNAMATEPAYAVVADVESYNPRVTVLNVLASDDGKYATIWILHDTAGITEDEWGAYLIDTLAHLYGAVRDAYPGCSAYAIIVAVPMRVSTIDGIKTQIRGGAAYILDSVGISRFLSNPTGDALDALLRVGQFIFEVIYYNNVTLTEILPREPGFIWPWSNGDSGCNTCQ